MSDGVSIQKMRRATTAEKKEIFEKFASIEEDGMKYMTPKDFLVDYVGLPVECEGTGLDQNDRLPVNQILMGSPGVSTWTCRFFRTSSYSKSSRIEISLSRSSRT